MILLATAAAFGEAIVTLKSGEVLRGDLLSDTNDVVELRVYSANRTISSRRSVARSDIQDFQNETPAVAAERTDYFALSKFQLPPDQEQSPNFYAQWIAAFEKFLKNYPKSDNNLIIQQHIEVCQVELKHIAAGEVKFDNQWMTPAEKKPLALTKQLTGLESQRDPLAKTVAAAQGQLTGLQATLPTFFDNFGKPIGDYQEPIYGTQDDGSWHHYSVRVIVGQRTVQNPERVRVQAAIVSCNQQIASGGQALATLDAKIQAIQIQLSQTQHTPPPPPPSLAVNPPGAPPDKPRESLYYQETTGGETRSIEKDR